MENVVKTEYTKEDTVCTHCGGRISSHIVGENGISWCDDCGSNNPSSPPSVEMSLGQELTKRG
jgi:hypothetical protein